MRATIDDYALLATLIRTLVVQSPDLLMYHPRKPIWGWVSVGSDIALHLDGCLAYVVALQSGALPADLEMDAGSLARALAAEMKLKTINDALLLDVPIDNRVHGPCCLVDGSRLSWRPMLITPTPTGDRVLQLPVGADIPRQRLSGVLMNPLLGVSPCSSLDDFIALIGPDPDIDVLPEPLRSARMTQWVERHMFMERNRLALLGHPTPAWMQAPARPAAVTRPASPLRRL